MSKPKLKQSLAQTLIEVALEQGTGQAFGAAIVAQRFRPATSKDRVGHEAWRTYIRQVRSEAIGLARQGQIEILRKGDVINPKEQFKGLYKMRLASTFKPVEEE